MKQNTPRMEMLRSARTEPTNFPPIEPNSVKALFSPVRRNRAAAPNSKKFTQGTLRVMGNLTRTVK
jgi:hypothetical protein